MRPEFDPKKKYSPTELEKMFFYMIEFEHLRGRDMWFKRRREDI